MLIGDVWISPRMVAELSELIGVHRTTVQRWLRTRTIPKATYKLLDILQNGSLAQIHSAWRGWKLCRRTGKLIPPNGGKAYTPGQLYAMQLNFQQISALKDQVTDLRATIASIEKKQAPIEKSTLCAAN